MADNGNEAPAAGDAGVEYIKLKVVGQVLISFVGKEGSPKAFHSVCCVVGSVRFQDSNEVHFRVKNGTAMGKLKKSYAERTGVAVSSLR
ncbi:unnamed protein product [Heligmosomoides polygyrus]|uniref:Rad60-SLD domain-containing protein n=1 Tax=Heligmosomoides polygyrus TaxID=6339 RepID=A0A183GWW1_HELPZ|nr:unnamed protein product [Heligmosomoides polygyrus]